MTEIGMKLTESGNILRAFEKMKDDRERQKAIDKGLRAGAKPIIRVARSKVKVGRRRTKGKHLKVTLGVKRLSKKGIHVIYVGARLHSPWYGFHHHLVEEGRKAAPGIGAIRPTRYLKRAAEVTASEQKQRVEEAIADFLEKASRG